VIKRTWTHLTRQRMAEILEQNAEAFGQYREELVRMQRFQDTRLRDLAGHDAILRRGFWGRLRWLVVGR